jgi:hypothetical protein
MDAVFLIEGTNFSDFSKVIEGTNICYISNIEFIKTSDINKIIEGNKVSDIRKNNEITKVNENPVVAERDEVIGVSDITYVITDTETARTPIRRSGL